MLERDLIPPFFPLQQQQQQGLQQLLVSA